MAKPLVSLRDLKLCGSHALLDLTRQVKSQPRHFRRRQAGKALALVFPLPSHFYRVIFELGMQQMGGSRG
ncbi:MAG: hypothetical protein ACERK6_01540 [Candidatus Aminicenantaceae bacterium]